jgi:signal transduction histidine kinase
MKFHQFILENMEQILVEWVNFARSIQPAKMTTQELRDHAVEMLKTIAKDVATSQTEYERSEKSKGHQPHGEGDTAAEIHADCRLNSGFTIDLLAAEYRALRASVLKLWFAKNTCSTQEQADELIRFNEAIDQALAESITRYTESMILAQDIFLGVLGHDLRDPLNSIGAGAQFLLHSTQSDERSVRLGSQMYTSVLRMNKMLDNLLNFTQSRIGGGLKIIHEVVDLTQISKQVIEEFHLAHPTRIIHNETNGDCTGNWDGGRLSQAYQNLISNALQYGSIESEIRVTTTGFNDHIIFTVQNYGTPIPVGNQRTIFNLMHRIPHVEEERNMKKNLGLGLYIVREIVTAHEGDISVSSTDEEGTVFQVKLPKNKITNAEFTAN